MKEKLNQFCLTCKADISKAVDILNFQQTTIQIQLNDFIDKKNDKIILTSSVETLGKQIFELSSNIQTFKNH